MARRKDPKKEHASNPLLAQGDIFASSFKSDQATPHEILSTQLRGALSRASGTKAGRSIRTILGEDFEHVFKEKNKLGITISANPLAASAVFGSTETPFLGSKGFTGTLALFKQLAEKAASGNLSASEKAFLDKQTSFSTDQGKFNALLSRRNAVVKAREEVEAGRRRSPGRTQTILTRREG